MEEWKRRFRVDMTKMHQLLPEIEERLSSVPLCSVCGNIIYYEIGLYYKCKVHDTAWLTPGSMLWVRSL